MSQKSVEILIGRLVTDETLRAQFLAAPARALQSQREAGMDLSSGETEALLDMSREAWPAMADWVHPRLQKIAMKGDRSEP